MERDFTRVQLLFTLVALSAACGTAAETAPDQGASGDPAGVSTGGQGATGGEASTGGGNSDGGQDGGGISLDAGNGIDGTPCCTSGACGIGICKEGTWQCGGEGTCTCINEIKPEPPQCDGLDHDCDGQPDTPTRPCCTSGKCGVGICTAGTQTCVGSGLWSDVCDNEQLPMPEACNGKDNNCDGEVDKPDPRPCCTSGLCGKGICKEGTQACLGDHWSDVCDGEQLPMKNRCWSQTNCTCTGKQVCDDPAACPCKESPSTAPFCCQGTCDPQDPSVPHGAQQCSAVAGSGTQAVDCY